MTEWRKGFSKTLPAVFRGATKTTLDAKGRLAIPTKHREKLLARCNGDVVVTVDRQRCLLIYPLRDWEDIERELNRLPSSNAKVRAYRQMMVGFATDVPLDSAARVLVPKEHREFAAIERQTWLIGQGTRFELWDQARWDAKTNGWVDDSAEDDGEMPPELAAIPW
ncbi:MAG: division/cell wall cluster transcriptional repressor MraZ [Pseudomonadota bacterium]